MSGWWISLTSRWVDVTWNGALHLFTVIFSVIVWHWLSWLHVLILGIWLLVVDYQLWEQLLPIHDTDNHIDFILLIYPLQTEALTNVFVFFLHEIVFTKTVTWCIWCGIVAYGLLYNTVYKYIGWLFNLDFWEAFLVRKEAEIWIGYISVRASFLILRYSYIALTAVK